MNEQLMKVRERFKDVTGKMSPKVKKIAIAGIVIAIVFSVVAAIVLNNKPYDVLFSGLTTEEASQIMGKLQEDNIDYKFQNGDTILIPKNLVDLQLAKLTYEGYPKSGFTYDIFRNNIDLMSTDFEKKKYELY